MVLWLVFGLRRFTVGLGFVGCGLSSWNCVNSVGHCVYCGFVCIVDIILFDLFLLWVVVFFVFCYDCVFPLLVFMVDCCFFCLRICSACLVHSLLWWCLLVGTDWLGVS